MFWDSPLLRFASVNCVPAFRSSSFENSFDVCLVMKDYRQRSKLKISRSMKTFILRDNSIVELFCCAYDMLRDINNVTGQSFKKVLEDVGGTVTLASYHTKKVLETFEGFDKLGNSLRDIFLLRMRSKGVVKVNRARGLAEHFSTGQKSDKGKRNDCWSDQDLNQEKNR